MDLSLLSTEDLQALQKGDLKSVSTNGLNVLKAAHQSQSLGIKVPQEQGLELAPLGAEVPGLALEKAGQGIESAGNFVSKIPGAAGMGSVAQSAGKVLGTTGKNLPQTESDFAIQGLGGKTAEDLIGAGTEVAKIAGRPIGRATAQMLGALSGLSEDGVKEIAENPGVAKKAIGSFLGKVSAIFNDAAQKKLDQGLNKGLSSLGKRIGDFEDKFISQSVEENGTPKMFSMKGSAANLKEELASHNIATGEAATALNVPGLQPPQAEFINDQIKKMEAGNMTFEDMLRNKRDIGQKIQRVLQNGGHKGEYDTLLSQVYHAYSDAIKDAIPEGMQIEHPDNGELVNAKKLWGDLNSDYAKGRSAYGKIYKKAVALASPEGTQSRILSSIEGENYELNKERAKEIGPEAVKALDDAKNMVLARKAKSLIPGHGGHGNLYWYLGLAGLAGSAYEGSRRGEDASIGLMMATSPLLVASLAASTGMGTKVAGQLAEAIAKNPALKRSAMQAVSEYMTSLHNNPKLNPEQQ